ncbi:hypothetical protein VNO78_01152 [Psophocarpus tetragonolobus]|uniref:Uncharacterized protein n=1 Tax=Psophocarpus tetragonolobus TaxID=3891 RepID=A0AAN9XVE1_PSOTE
MALYIVQLSCSTVRFDITYISKTICLQQPGRNKGTRDDNFRCQFFRTPVAVVLSQIISLIIIGTFLTGIFLIALWLCA